MRVIVRITILAIAIMFLNGCSVSKDDTLFVEVKSERYRIISDSEKMIKLKQISKYLKEEYQIEDDIKDELDINILLGNAELMEDEIELVKINVAHKWLDGFIVYRENEIVGFLDGMDEAGLFVTDLNKDGSHEVIYKSEIGSGMRSILISAYDTNSGEIFDLRYYNDNNGIEFDVKDEKIAVYSYYYDLVRRSEDPIGYLELNEEELVISEPYNQ